MQRACVGFSVLAFGLARAEDISFDSFVVTHGKPYASGSAEYEQRRAIFEANKQKVIAHNKEYEAGLQTWYMKLNHLADHTEEEFAMLRGGERSLSSRMAASEQAKMLKTAAASNNPASIDWREKGVVTPPKNQGSCGSCWAFASTETMESQYAIATGKLLELAPQAYVNCAENTQQCGGTGGCAGATEEIAFNTSSVVGLPLEKDLPYQGQNGQCSKYKAAVKNKGFVKLPSNDAAAFETALATKGPIAITVAAQQWMLYGGGIFDGCTGKDGSVLDHGVQAVGYTPEYWIVRNSWGPAWGEKGYIYISRKSDNVTTEDTSPADGIACPPIPKSQPVAGMCGLFADSSYPTFEVADSSDTDASLLV